MVGERQLVEVAIQTFRWADAAEDVVSWGGRLSLEIDEAAHDLAQSVVKGVVGVGDLRAGVVWANALDYEAVELHGADLTGGLQLHERVARRIMHGAGRNALELVKTESRRDTFRACNRS